eukprot:11933130-Alexandrium_andersonii.AAC.1
MSGWARPPRSSGAARAQTLMPSGCAVALRSIGAAARWRSRRVAVVGGRARRKVSLCDSARATV